LWLRAKAAWSGEEKQRSEADATRCVTVAEALRFLDDELEMPASAVWKVAASVAAAVTLVAVAPGAVLADGGAPDPEKLFREGNDLLAQSKFAEACAKFDASEKAKDSLTTLGALADCHEKAGENPRAYQEFGAIAARANADFDTKVAEGATARRRGLEAKLGKLVLTVPPGSNVEVALDGVTLTTDRLGAELLLNAGDHVVRSTMPGSPPQATEGTVTVPPDLGTLSVAVPTKPGDKFVATNGPPKPVAPQQIIVQQSGPSTAPLKEDKGVAAGWIVLGVFGIIGGVGMTGAAIGLFVQAADETGSANTEDTAGGVALIILGPLCLAGGIGSIYYGIHPSKLPAVNMNPFAFVPDLLVGPRYAGLRWHF
jgi:hypothetical protein